MKRSWCLIAAAIVHISSLVFSQPTNNSTESLKFENGTIANGVYSNECFGFSLPIPAGWEVNPILGANGRAVHTPGGGLTLLLIHQQKENSPGNTIALMAQDSSFDTGTVQSAVSRAVHNYINGNPADRELIRDAFAVEYGGRTFYRADAKQSLGKDGKLYLADLFTRFRGFFIGGSWTAESPEELDQAADLLRKISFQEDRINPRCSMGNDDPPMPGGVIGGIISSKPTPPKVGIPQRVRVSSGVAQGLLVRKVPPVYPLAARQAGIQGQVILTATINKNGDVEKLTVVSGDPTLADAAVDAVKQWKYKPYLLNGQPVFVETQVLVNFTLSPR